MRKPLTLLVVVVAAIASLMVPPAAVAASPTEYITVSDGTLIAVNVRIPSGTAPVGGWPIVITIDGYDGASGPIGTGAYGNHYATAHMSLRGTGCSAGKFDLFDRRSALDGYEVIENLAHRSWANGKVAIQGHSYSGITGWLVASTRPPSLVAMSVSGLIDDLYRGIVYMGGVSNLGFPLFWTGLLRPASDYGTGVWPGVQAGDATCIANQAGRVPPSVLDDSIVNAVGSLGEDGQWWASHALITYLDSIDVPTHIVQTYQDEQTGPRGSNLLWQKLDEAKPWLPKRLLLTNGIHSTNTGPSEVWSDRVAFLDCYVRSVCSPDILDPAKRVKVLWEMHRNSSGHLVSNGVTADPDWPLSVTQWTRYNFQPGGGLSTAAPPATSAADPYVAGSKRAGAWTYLVEALSEEFDVPVPGPLSGTANAGAEATTANLPDEVRYATEAFGSDTAIAGPIDVTLYASSTTPDTEFYVELNDVDADGNMTRLQRGMLKASHRALDLLHTDFNAAGEIIRPYHPHTNTLTNLLTPAEIYKFDLEVFPVGHVFRAGHKLVLRVTTPPATDSLAFYVPMTGAGVNFISHDQAHPSSILLPVVPASSVPALGPALACGAQVGLERCSKPIN